MDQRQRMVYLTHDIAYFVQFKLKTCSNPCEIDESVLRRSLVENMRAIVWVEKHIAAEEVSHFFSQHRERMKSRIDLHINYLLYLCFLVRKCFTNAYEVYIRTMTILFTLPTYEETYTDTVPISATIFDWFSNDIAFDFKSQGGFEKLNCYLRQRDTLRLYSKLEELEEAGETSANIFKQLKLQTSELKVHLDKDIKKEDIENHVPSLGLLKLILNCGSGNIQNMLSNNVMYIKDLPIKDQVGKNSQAVGGSGKTIGSELPGKDSNDSSKTAYFKARRQIMAFQEKCKHLEQLLDFVFQETSSNDV